MNEDIFEAERASVYFTCHIRQELSCMDGMGCTGVLFYRNSSAHAHSAHAIRKNLC